MEKNNENHKNLDLDISVLNSIWKKNSKYTIIPSETLMG